MIYRKLGRTDIEISALSVGCYQITSEYGGTYESAAAILDLAVMSGINYFDTAPLYGNGEAEEHVGRMLWRHRDSGKEIYVNDKVGRYPQWNPGPQIPGNPVISPDQNYRDRKALTMAIKRSLWILRRDYFDVLTIHEPHWPQWGFDYDTGNSVVMELLEEFKKEGLLRYIGIGGWDLHINAKLVNTGRIDVVMAAGGMNLLAKPILEELLPAARRHQTGIVLGGALGQGNPLLLTQDRAALDKLYRSGNPRAEITAGQLKGLYGLCEGMGITMAELAVRYILSFEYIHSHAAGARIPEHLISNIESVKKGPLPADALNEIERIQGLGTGLSTREVSALIMKL